MISHVSDIGVRRLESREGIRYKRYIDSVGVPTIGCGHTGRMSGDTRLPETCTQAQVDAWLHADLAQVESALSAVQKGMLKWVSGPKGPLTQNEYDASASFAFNIGISGYMHSSHVACLLRGDFKGAANAMLMWEKPATLVARRESEKLQFNTPYPPVTNGPRQIPSTAPVVAEKMDAKPTTEIAKARPMGKLLVSTGLAGNILSAIFTYGPKVASLAAHAVSNSADVKAKGADMIQRLGKFDLPGAEVDLNAILADFGLDTTHATDAIGAATVSNVPDVSGALSSVLNGIGGALGIPVGK